MNKTDLIDEVAGQAGITKATAGKAIEAVFLGIEQSLRKGQNVTVVGFGSFGISRRSARVGRNPQSGAPLTIRAKKVVRFKAGKALDKKINK